MSILEIYLLLENKIIVYTFTSNRKENILTCKQIYEVWNVIRYRKERKVTNLLESSIIAYNHM